MQGYVNLGMLGEKLHEWEVGLFVTGSEDAAEIAARLVRVNKQREVKLRRGRRHETGCSLFSILPFGPAVVLEPWAGAQCARSFDARRGGLVASFGWMMGGKVVQRQNAGLGAGKGVA